MNLKALAVDHDYYSSDANYYSNEARGHYTTFADFYEEYAECDVDMNLIFRWDIMQREKSERYYAKVFMIHQRKGIYMPITIDYIDEADVPKFIELVSKHWEKLISIWSPISVAMPTKEHLTRLVWDGLLTAELQDEQWHDEDTCRLIVKKILTDEKIEYAKGSIPL